MAHRAQTTYVVVWAPGNNLFFHVILTNVLFFSFFLRSNFFITRQHPDGTPTPTAASPTVTMMTVTVTTAAATRFVTTSAVGSPPPPGESGLSLSYFTLSMGSNGQ